VPQAYLDQEQDQCEPRRPVPHAGHTWSKCFSNVCNKDIKKNATTTKVNKKKEKVQEANVANIALGKDHVINDDNSFLLDGEPISEVCCLEDDLVLMDLRTDLTVTVPEAEEKVRQYNMIRIKSLFALTNLSLIT
jgi:hypothetical protein